MGTRPSLHLVRQIRIEAFNEVVAQTPRGASIDQLMSAYRQAAARYCEKISAACNLPAYLDAARWFLRVPFSRARVKIQQHLYVPFDYFCSRVETEGTF